MTLHAGPARKFPWLATLLTALSMLILIGLGTWQVKRLAWKADIISRLNILYDIKQARPLQWEDGQNYAYGWVEGKPLYDQAFLMVPRVLDKQVGASYMLPLLAENGQSYLVNMGWTDQKLPDISSVGGMNVLKVSGLARHPYWNSFTPENAPEQGQWFRPDLEQIASAQQLNNLQPFILYAENIEGLPESLASVFPQNERWMPPNNHGQYAFFWYAMAMVLLGIYVLRFYVFGQCASAEPMEEDATSDIRRGNRDK